MGIYSELTMLKVPTKGTLINNTSVNKLLTLTTPFNKNRVWETKKFAIKTIISNWKEVI